MRGHRRRSERLLRRTHVEATRAWHCPLAAEGGEVDRAPEPRLATRHDGRCQRTPPTRLRAHAGSASQWPPRHAFGSRSLASGAACSRTSSPSDRLRNPTNAAPTRANTSSSGDGTPRRTAADVTAQGGADAHVDILEARGGDGWPARRRQFGRRHHAGECCPQILPIEVPIKQLADFHKVPIRQSADFREADQAIC
jgi:hypothetical protein